MLNDSTSPVSIHPRLYRLLCKAIETDMSWQIEALGGPVLAWEMKRATRRKLWRGLQIGYCAWLALQAAALFAIFSTSWVLPDEPLSRLELHRTIHLQQIEFLDYYFALLLQFQLVLIITIIPAITASSLGQEKERGTLFALFGTALTSRQILLGKLLGRLILVMPLVLTTLPALVFIATLTGRGLTPLILALAQEAVIALALGAACLLFGIWIRRGTDAMVAAYLFLGLAYLIIRGLTASLPQASWFDPVDNLRELLNEGSQSALVAHLAVWAFLGAVCLRLGWGRLRKVCVEQRDKRPSRRLWAFRPAVGNNPIRWRECYVIGLAPMPILRIVPRWAALLAVATFSAAVVGMIANSFAPGFIPALLRIDLVQAFEELRWRGNKIDECVPLMGLVFILLANLLVGVRCGTSVAEEKRRNTWDDLLLTAQSFREITSGKMWGVLQATVPYIIAYALPVFFLASAGGPNALLTAGMWIILPCAIVFVAALMGIDMLRVPPHMDETRQEGAFWFENERARRQRHLARRRTATDY
jgi:ABC-type transport system involved in multi-copper enzyme maturation permease subunit